MPNILEDLKATPKKPETYLEGVNFDSDGCEVSYTCGAGAASLLNEPYLLKAKDGDSSELTEDEAKLLKKLTSSAATEVDGSGGDDINKDKGDDDMSKELEAQVAELTKQLATEKAKGTLGKFGFTQEVEEGVAKALASLEEAQSEAVVKALDFLVDCGEYGVAKAIADAPVETEENSLKKELDSEEGVEADAEEAVLSKAEIIKQKRGDK